MARCTIKGLNDWSVKLQELGEAAHEIMGAAVYEGARVVADGVKQALGTIPIDDGYKPNGVPRKSATQDEINDLRSAVGIARFDSTGGKVSTAVGFDGYSSHKTKKYPGGVPLPMIARSIESGSSVRQKHPFMRRTANNLKGAAQEAMVRAAAEEIRKHGGN
ncbi:MAG: hypothetical protein IJ246_05320 [Clostridia bacterium]|nr:hypothetical protein [Clostridia bacterium]